MRRNLVLAVACVAALAACSDDDSASDQVCAAREELSSSVEQVVSDVGDGNLSEAQDGLGDVQTAYDSLKDDVGELADEEREQLAPATDALEADIAALADSSSLEDLQTGVEAVVTDVEGITQEISDALSC